MAQFYVGWSASADTINAAGQFTAPLARDTVTITATTPTGISDQTTVIVAAPAATLVRVSGDAQSGVVGSRLPLPLVVRVDGSDALPVSGVPVSDNSCAYLPSTTRNWTGCLNAGCHASADVAASALVNERAVIANLADQLWNDVNPTLNTGGEPYMDAAAAGYLPYLLFVAGNPTVDGVQAFNANDNIVSPPEGALWNAMMFAEDLYDRRPRMPALPPRVPKTASAR